MLNVQIDLIKNRLYLTVGSIHHNNIRLSVNLVEKALCKLEAGFTCITRVIDAVDFDREEIEEIQTIQKLLAEHEMAHMVLIGDVKGRHLLKTFGREVPYRITEAASMEEAEEILDEWVKQHENAADDARK